MAINLVSLLAASDYFKNKKMVLNQKRNKYEDLAGGGLSKLSNSKM